MHEALYYRIEDKDSSLLRCELCPQHCRLEEGQTGICGVRRAEGGKLLALNYNRCASLALDPIEKKPLYHFYPGWLILSAGTFGCNLHCSFCQNWSLARGDDRGSESLSAQKLLELLQQRERRAQLGVAFTYNEPSVWYEFVLESSRLLHENGFKSVLVSNGMINPAPLAELLPFIHGMNIDVKAFDDSFYQRHCKGKGLGTVQHTVEEASRRCHVELTYLVIPTLNDSPDEISAFVDWVVSIDKDIPVHFSRYHPQYRLQLPPTPLQTLERAWEMARQKLSHVYLGNVPDSRHSNTSCPVCSQLLIERRGYTIKNCGLSGTNCSACGNTIRLTGHIYGEEVK